MTSLPTVDAVWESAALDSNLCDMVVSPDGLSVRQRLFFPLFVLGSVLYARVAQNQLARTTGDEIN